MIGSDRIGSTTATTTFPAYGHAGSTTTTTTSHDYDHDGCCWMSSFDQERDSLST